MTAIKVFGNIMSNQLTIQLLPKLPQSQFAKRRAKLAEALPNNSIAESVCFDNNEEVLASGFASGVIKLWDLASKSVKRTITGHTSCCTAVDVNPYGQYCASASQVRAFGCCF